MRSTAYLLLLAVLMSSSIAGIEGINVRRGTTSDSSEVTIGSPIAAIDKDETVKTVEQQPHRPIPSTLTSLVSRIPGVHLIPPPVSRLLQKISGGSPIVMNAKDPNIEDHQLERKKRGVLAVKKAVGGIVVAKLAAPVVLKAAKVAAIASLIPIKLAAKGALIGGLIAKPFLIKSALIGGKAAKVASLAIGKPLLLASGAAAAGTAIKSKLAGTTVAVGSKIASATAGKKVVSTSVSSLPSKTVASPIVGPTKTNPDIQQQHQQSEAEVKTRQLDSSSQAALSHSSLDSQAYELLR